jgi:glucose uptake protein GlcU
MNSKGLVFGIVMGILWSVAFVNALNSLAGIGIGMCFGISFSLLGSSMFKFKDNKKEDSEKN